MTRALLFALALGLTACATAPALYAPALRPDGAGFSEQKVDNDRYRVVFRDAANEALAADYATLRAAEITLAQGYDWFIVDHRSSDRQATNAGPRVSIGGGTASYGRHTSVGIGTSVGFNLGGGAKSTVVLDIRLGHGPKPADANAYDARQVQAMIRQRM